MAHGQRPNKGPTKAQQRPNKGPTMAQQRPNKGPTKAHGRTCDGEVQKRKNEQLNGASGVTRRVPTYSSLDHGGRSGTVGRFGQVVAAVRWESEQAVGRSGRSVGQVGQAGQAGGRAGQSGGRACREGGGEIPSHQRAKLAPASVANASVCRPCALALALARTFSAYELTVILSLGRCSCQRSSLAVGLCVATRPGPESAGAIRDLAGTRPARGALGRPIAAPVPTLTSLPHPRAASGAA